MRHDFMLRRATHIHLLDELMEDILLHEVNILFYRDFYINYNTLINRNILSVSNSIDNLIHKKINNR